MSPSDRIAQLEGDRERIIKIYADEIGRLIDRNDELVRENSALQLEAKVARENYELYKEENRKLRNEIARLNGQTRWQCKCGGTDTSSAWRQALDELDSQGIRIENLKMVLEDWMVLIDKGLEDTSPEWLKPRIQKLAKETEQILK